MDVVSNDDYEFIHGELKLQIPSSKGIDPTAYPDLYLKFFLLGATASKVTKSVKLTVDANGTVKWNAPVKIPIIQVLRVEILELI